MDIDHLKKLVDACIEEAERTNDTRTTYPKLVAYLDAEVNRKPLHEAARMGAFVQGWIRGCLAADGGTMASASDHLVLELIATAHEAYVALRKERGR